MSRPHFLLVGLLLADIPPREVKVSQLSTATRPVRSFSARRHPRRSRSEQRSLPTAHLPTAHLPTVHLPTAVDATRTTRRARQGRCQHWIESRRARSCRGASGREGVIPQLSEGQVLEEAGAGAWREVRLSLSRSDSRRNHHKERPLPRVADPRETQHWSRPSRCR